MPKRKELTPSIEGADALARLLDDFDYEVEGDDFLLYELSNLIEEDRANFEDEGFRRVVDAGIRQHFEERPGLRGRMWARLRLALPDLSESTKRIALRTIRALEDMDFPLHNVSLVVRTYTAYMFRRLEEAADQPATPEEDARALIERWRDGQIIREEMMKRLKHIGGPAVGPVADLLFDSSEDREAVETSIEILGGIRTSSSARVLAHVIADPVLPEDLEMRTYGLVKSMWPLPRHYILYTLATHTHEDLSFRWFQLLVESDELAAVDMILEEVLVHAGNPAYTEDLKAIVELLRLSRDPDVEEKVVAVLNAEDTPPPGVTLLEEFASRFTPSAQPAENPWAAASRQADLNRKYLAAAKLYDSGKHEDARRVLDSIVGQDPQHPFARALKDMPG